MSEADYINIKPSVFTFTSKSMDLEKFLEITTNFKIDLLVPEKKQWGQSIINRLYNDINKECFFGTAGVYFVVGSKF